MKKKLKLGFSEGIKRLKISTSRLVNTGMVGNYRSGFKGHGLEFEDYRPYTSFDDASLIDWKASVRSHSLLIKEFVEERNLNVFFLVDVSSSMVYGSIDKLKIEYAAELVAALSYTILQAGDSIGFAFFNDKVVIHEPFARGMKQYYKLMKALVDTNNYSGNYDAVQALKFILGSLKEFSIVVIISDFIGLNDDWKYYLKMMGKKFDLIGIMVHDPADEILPDFKGYVVFADPFSSKQIIADSREIGEKYAKYVELREKEIKDAFMQSNSDFIKLRTDKPFVKPLTDLFIRRMKMHK